jgi:hypothetical protein
MFRQSSGIANEKAPVTWLTIDTKDQACDQMAGRMGETDSKLWCVTKSGHRISIVEEYIFFMPMRFPINV